MVAATDDRDRRFEQSSRRVTVWHRPETTLPAMPDRVELSTSTVRTDDWPAQATDQIVKVVGTVHDKVTGPIMTVARGVVYGTFAAILGAAALDADRSSCRSGCSTTICPIPWFGENHVWAAYLIVGFLLCVGAALLWWNESAEVTSRRDDREHDGPCHG